jgi:2-C-methyl-D-erythritol 4-phosphate cytidylyltransferase
MDTYVIIVAAGIGKRMGADKPKQFLPLKGKTILQHTLESFHCFDPTFKYIVVLHKDYIDFWKSHLQIKKINIAQQLVVGGKERFFSVKNALALIKSPSIVAIHDSVRPFVSKKTLKNCFDTVKKYGNAVPVVSVNDSIRYVNGEDSKSLNREHYKIVQTPQCFMSDILIKAYEQAYRPDFTDDASVVESMGIKINLVEGNTENIKITKAEDLLLAKLYADSLKR